MNYLKIKRQIKRHEGCVLKPYRDSVNILTVGYGHNLEAHGISKYVAEIIFEEDFRRAVQNAEQIPEYYNLNNARRGVLINMVFNLGLSGVLGFKRMLREIRDKNWDKAAEEMLDSKWARQVGIRARALAEIMRSGKFED